MSWKERFSCKMNRSSWKIAHDDAHPHVEDIDDLQSHLFQHHKGDCIGDVDDHEWFHLDPDGYNNYNEEAGYRVTNNQPDHYHTYDYGNLNVPNELPQSFASKIAHNDLHPWPNNREELLNHFQSHHENAISNNGSGWSRARLLQFMHDNPDIGLRGHTYIHKEARKYMGPEDHEHDDDFNVDVPNEVPVDLISKVTVSFKKLADPTDTLRGEGISGMIDPDEEVVGPQDLDSNATEVDKFPKSVGVFKNSSWITANGGSQFGEPIDYGENRLQDVEDTSRLQSRFPLDTGKRNYSEQRADANPLTLRSWFTGDDVNGPWPHTKNLSGPLDFEPTDDQNEDSTGPITGSFQSRYTSSLNEDQGTYEPPEKEEPEYYPILDKIKEKNSFQGRYAHFDDMEHPFPDEDSIRDHLSTHHFGDSPIGDDYLGQPFRERLPLFNKELLGEHLNFHYDDTLNENPLVGKSSWTIPHKHGDDIKIDVPNKLGKLNDFQSRYAHEDKHPWPNNGDELFNHVVSHHETSIQKMMNKHDISREQVLRYIGENHEFYLGSHVRLHKNPEGKVRSFPLTHEHDDDFDVDVPDNIETIAPTYVTSSWHEAFVETFDTHPDEETPDSLLNPADELKNGRPRANDLPNQSAQLIPGMLIDHDQMGGSGTASGSF